MITNEDGRSALREEVASAPLTNRALLLMSAELQAIHRYVHEMPVLEAATEEIGAVVESVYVMPVAESRTIKTLSVDG
jgi:hypothetical protein